MHTNEVYYKICLNTDSGFVSIIPHMHVHTQSSIDFLTTLVLKMEDHIAELTLALPVEVRTYANKISNYLNIPLCLDHLLVFTCSLPHVSFVTFVAMILSVCSFYTMKLVRLIILNTFEKNAS